MKVAKKTESLITIVAIALVMAGVASALYLLFRTTETHVSTRQSKSKVDALVCLNKTTINESFFNSNGANDVEQKIKITFLENKANQLSYTFEGNYETPEKASQSNDILHADYNNYMGNYADKLNPVFSVIENRLKINLFVDMNQLDTKVGEIFRLSNEEIINIANYTMTDLVQIYQNKGFSCKADN